MNVSRKSHLPMLAKAEAWARWHVRHMTFAFSSGLSMLEEWRSETSVVPRSKGTRARYAVASEPWG